MSVTLPPARPVFPAASVRPVTGAAAELWPGARHHRRDAVVRLGALVTLWGALLLVAYWWAAGGGIGDLTGWEAGLDSTGRLTGLIASVLLLAQVLLMARLPVLERAFGQDRLAVLHRLVGFLSFNLMVAHIVLITWGYAAGRILSTPATLWDLTIHYPGMLLAVAGTLCLVMVVVTSIRAARRRLRYESWHLLHLYAYLGVALALPHQIWTGQDFVGSFARTVFWWGLWIAAAGSVIVFRLLLPTVRAFRYRLRVTAVLDEGDGVVSVYMVGTGRRIPAEAGQFLHFRFLTGQGWLRSHPFSLSAAPDGHRLRISAKIVGDGTRGLASLRPGTRVLVEGAFGRLSARARSRRRVLLFGAGVGIAPLRALAEGLDYGPGEVTLIHRFTDRPLFDREIDELGLRRGLEIIQLPGHRRGDGSCLNRGVGSVSDAEWLRAWVPGLAERDVYVCGPEPWAADVRRAVTAAGVPADRFHAESFGW